MGVIAYTGAAVLLVIRLHMHRYVMHLRADVGFNQTLKQLFACCCSDLWMNLNDKQMQAWQQAKNQLQQLRAQAKQVGKEEWQKVRKVVDEEAAKANPDLAKVQKAKMAMRDKMMQLRNQRQRIEMDFYNKLNAEQKKQVFANMQKRMDKYAQYHEKNKKMMEQ